MYLVLSVILTLSGITSVENHRDILAQKYIEQFEIPGEVDIRLDDINHLTELKFSLFLKEAYNYFEDKNKFSSSSLEQSYVPYMDPYMFEILRQIITYESDFYFEDKVFNDCIRLLKLLSTKKDRAVVHCLGFYYSFYYSIITNEMYIDKDPAVLTEFINSLPPVEDYLLSKFIYLYIYDIDLDYSAYLRLVENINKDNYSELIDLLAESNPKILKLISKETIESYYKLLELEF